MEDISAEITQNEHPINEYPVRNGGTGTISCPYCLKAIARYAKAKFGSKIAEEILSVNDLAEMTLYYNSQLILELIELQAWKSDISSLFYIRCKKHAAEQSFFDRSLKANVFFSYVREEDNWKVLCIDTEDDDLERIPFIRLITDEDGYWGNIAIFYKDRWFTFDSNERHIRRIYELVYHSAMIDGDAKKLIEKVLQWQ